MSPLQQMQHYLAVDTETTGLKAGVNQVLTAYFVVVDSTLQTIAQLDLSIKYAEYNVNERAMEINKIDLVEHDKTALSVADARTKLKEFIQSNCIVTTDTIDTKPMIIMGHNVGFDLKMLKGSNILQSDTIDTLLQDNSIDTMLIAKSLKKYKQFPKDESMSLVNLCSAFKLELSPTEQTLGAHNAEYDIKMTIELLKRLLGMINNLKDTSCSFNSTELYVIHTQFIPYYDLIELFHM